MIDPDSIVTGPSVAGVMVTRERPERAIRAIRSFAAQDYTNKRLVVVCDGAGDGRLSDAIASVSSLDVTMTTRPLGRLTLGALRNLAVDMAGAEYVTQWDDDDLYHVSRISLQVASVLLHDADACFLTDQLHYIERTRSLYWCDWSAPREHGPWARTIPNTLLCKTGVMPRYPESGPLSARSEDLFVMERLLAGARTVATKGVGYLYVYVQHGCNTWAEDHHLRIIRRCGLDTTDLIQRRAVLDDAVRQYGLVAPLMVRSFRDEPALCLSDAGELVGALSAPVTH